jgi:cytochrome P450
MSSRARCELDFTSAEFVRDPYPALAVQRALGPIGWHDDLQLWVVVSHEHCSAVLRDRRLGRIWTDRQPAERYAPFNLLHRNQMMENEPPNHSRLRRKVSAAFARGHIERMRPRVLALGAALLDEVGAEAFDVLAAYAEPLPVQVIAELLGAPGADVARLRAWSQAIVRMYEPTVPPEDDAAAVAASIEFADYMRDLVAERRAHLRDDLLSDLIGAQSGSDGFTDDEVLASAILLLNAGHEASVNVFGNGLAALLKADGQWSRLVRREVPAEIVVEEMLRYDSALQLFERTATTNVEVAGQSIRQGERVAVLLGSANRDESVFDSAETFDAGRDPNPHLAFGAGLHFCLGAPLARMELAESLRLLSATYPDLTLADAAQLERRPTFVLRGYSRMPVLAGTREKVRGG